MKRETLVLSALLSALSVSAGYALAADQDRAMSQSQDQAQEQSKTQDKSRTQPGKLDQIYGSQLMTRQERMQYHAKMHAAKTAEEREQIRKAHHDEMQERAKARGMTLPDEPPAKGDGMMGPGGGMPPGGGMMGPGGGMRPGGGMGPRP